MKFKISRRKWARGGDTDTQLHSIETHRECCLGQIGRQAGCRLAALRDKGLPSMVKGKSIEPYKKLGLVGPRGADTRLAQRMIAINDNEKITDEVREKRLKEVAAKQGWEIEFVS